MTQKKMDSFVLDVSSKAILHLFDCSRTPIRGKQLMTYMVFTLVKEFAADAESFFGFYPYLYGPYSGVFGNRLNKLMEAEAIQAESIKGVWAYSITEKGRKLLADIFMTDEDYALWEVQHLSHEDTEARLSEMIEDYQARGRQEVRKRLEEIYPEYFTQAYTD